MRNYPAYGIILCSSVLFLLVIYNLCFYAIPAEKLVDTRQSWLLKSINIAFALCWVTLPPVVFPHGDANDRVLVAGIMVGLTATTITLIPLVGLGEVIAFMLVLSCCGALFSAWTIDHSLFYFYIAIELTIYLFFVLSLTMAVRTLFTAFLVSRYSLEQRNSIVQLLLRNADDDTGDWLWETCAAGTLRNVSASLAAAFGYSREWLENRGFSDILSDLAGSAAFDGDERTGLGRLKQCFDNRIFFRDIVVSGTLHGQKRFWSLSGRPIFRERIFIGYRGVGTDVTQTHWAQESASFRARHDLLTGLPNRGAFLDDMETYLIEAERTGEAFALLNLDLDGFKQINDRYGHSSGDEMLRKVTVVLSRTLSDRHRLYRFGGDEFMLLERQTTPTQAAATATGLINALTNVPIRVGEGVRCAVGLSVGLVLSVGGSERVGSLLEASDLALYEAKSLGGHTHRFYNPELRTVAKRNRDLIRALPEALEEGKLGIMYQPFFNIQSQKLCGFEALIRWSHPEYGRVPPERIIQLAEEAGLIHRLGVYVMERACQFAHEWEPGLVLSINVSVGQLEAPAFLTDTFRILEKTGFPARCLQIEMTENIFMEPDAATFTLLNRLQNAGISIALDDFGKGFSSLGYLRFFPFSKIKLDGLFVRDMLRESRAASIVRAVVDLSIDLGVAVTAEGVESQEQLSYLKRLGCTEVQGYLLSRPLSPEDTRQFMLSPPVIMEPS
ncbi:putative bifunctional diguanylate cyclase/phosphodiesterase [Gluconobacter kanchanaburiensis]|uniref:GGDEF domain-containing protein n=1 Tax=Gluconobacter kanchanaburiensis NBRC 103587 TaxID=1307948 RepID=A0A511B5F0_9PROT|nr:bifunctional diguanylate cyclase/phosphodiesterase [Gluconobacter kanchanaburiensis]GBR67923.1 diguanylate cyclase [Gluconobacter kanchanaburiensis NBRC 103587]GEK95618.1 GGDEF domain-containing protein [Gluconobacter kanchanaburiensis NBRC 103587]